MDLLRIIFEVFFEIVVKEYTSKSKRLSVEETIVTFNTFYIKRM